MQELEGMLADLEGKLSGFLGQLTGEVENKKGQIQTVDQGALAALDTCLGEVEAVRASLIEQITKVEAKAAALRPSSS